VLFLRCALGLEGGINAKLEGVCFESIFA